MIVRPDVPIIVLVVGDSLLFGFADTLNDLENIQNGVGFPILVCNENLALLRFNSPAAALFSLTTTSLKQTMSLLRLPPGMQDFSSLVRQAMDGSLPVEAPVFSSMSL